jgi:effector-binding domain-containing protein
MHYGPYEESEATWIAAFEWAEQHGIEFSTGPAFEHYLDDPETTAPENLRTEIFIPLVPGQGAVPMQHGAEFADKHGQHGSMGDVEGAPEFNVSIDSATEPFYFVYLAGTASSDFGMEITRAVEAADAQGLLESEEIKVAAVYPDAMVNGYHDETPVYFGVGLMTAPDVEPPLDVYEIPPGDYLMAEHYGDYSGLADFWMQVFEWAGGHGIEFDSERPCAEIYVSDPMSTPVEEVLTIVVIPIAPGQAHEIE